MIVVAFAFVGWALCFATIGLGMATMSKDNALIVHAIAAPVFFMVLSLIYFTRFGYTTPLATAAMFVGFVVTMDFVLVSLVILRSLDPFTSLIGTWIPFSLIFLSAYLTGLYVTRRGAPARRQVATPVSPTT